MHFLRFLAPKTAKSALLRPRFGKDLSPTFIIVGLYFFTEITFFAIKMAIKKIPAPQRDGYLSKLESNITTPSRARGGT